MRKTPLLSAKTDEAITMRQLKQHGKGWLMDGEIRQLSETTLENRCFFLKKLLWFLRHMEYDECVTMEIIGLLAYIANGYKEVGTNALLDMISHKPVNPVATILDVSLVVRSSCARL